MVPVVPSIEHDASFPPTAVVVVFRVTQESVDVATEGIMIVQVCSIELVAVMGHLRLGAGSCHLAQRPSKAVLATTARVAHNGQSLFAIFVLIELT